MTQSIQSLPVVILHPHRRCNCRCVMCDIWKSTTNDEFSVADLERQLEDFDRLGVRWVVLSGGEPLMHSDLFRFCALLRSRGLRVTILSTGLLLERNAQAIVDCVDDVILSLDGPPAVHNEIRRVQDAYVRLARGTKAIHRIRPGFPLSVRCTVQRLNHDHLCATAKSAQELGCRSISFLAADVTSEAFNRIPVWSAERQQRVALTERQIERLEEEIQRLLSEWGSTGFLAESSEKLQRIVWHFRAHLGLVGPVSPHCNAPWVSAVIESDGTVRPCFFHAPIGKLGERSFSEVLNGPSAMKFRASLDIQNNSTCQRCVCSLNWKQSA